MSANGNMYDHLSAFQKWGFIDQCQGDRKYTVGDNIYIYCTSPLKRVMYKTVVEKVNLTKDEIVDDSQFSYDKEKFFNSADECFARLHLIEQVNRDELSLENLKKNGLKSAPRRPIKLKDQLKKYVDKYMVDAFHENIFPDSAETENCIEGAHISVKVNRYERSSVARQKCIDANGCYCHICGLDFEKQYGEVGADFIHVHHVIPLNEISKEYIVDPVHDLIPVCPNCHAMLHRKINNKCLSIDELKNLFKNTFIPDGKQFFNDSLY
jgi:5-methylcytosine-specific restriction protein A